MSLFIIHMVTNGNNKSAHQATDVFSQLFCSSLHQLDDAGTYTCVATNAVGQDSRTVTLTIQTHPAFTELLGDIALNKGERLLLTCGVSGIPPPRITWVFNNNVVPGKWTSLVSEGN